MTRGFVGGVSEGLTAMLLCDGMDNYSDTWWVIQCQPDCTVWVYSRRRRSCQYQVVAFVPHEMCDVIMSSASLAISIHELDSQNALSASSRYHGICSIPIPGYSGESCLPPRSCTTPLIEAPILHDALAEVGHQRT